MAGTKLAGQKNSNWMWYVDHLTIITDLKVIFITIKKVLFREDINSDNDATMEDFDGTN